MSKKTKHRFQEFPLRFFSKAEHNEIKTINGFILFKHWDGNFKCWRVDLFTEDSWQRMKNPPKIVEKERAITNQQVNQELEEKYLLD